MNLHDIILADPYHRRLENVSKLYHGKEHCCRCGCGGSYFLPGSIGFGRAMKKMLKPAFNALQKDVNMWTKDGHSKCEGVVYGENYIDIQYNADNDKCYCLYFD